MTLEEERKAFGGAAPHTGAGTAGIYAAGGE